MIMPYLFAFSSLKILQQNVLRLINYNHNAGDNGGGDDDGDDDDGGSVKDGMGGVWSV